MALRRPWQTFAAVALLAAALAPASAGGPGHAVAGVTVDPSGAALAGVEIRVARLGHGAGSLPLVRVQSDELGRFALTSLAPGAYRVVAVKGGYAVLIGQIDTVFQSTLELVLRPAANAAPGTKPADNSWTLRLPRRDVLEEHGFDFETEFSAGASAPGEVVFDPENFSVDVVGIQLDGDGDTGGYGLRAGAGFDTGFGRVTGRLAHIDESAGSDLSDSNTGLRVRWIPDAGEPGRTFAVDIDVLRRNVASAESSDPGSAVDFGAVRWGVRDAREGAVWSRELAAEVILAQHGAGSSDPADGEDRNVARLAARARLARPWGGQHLVSLALDAAGARGAFEAAQPNDIVILPMEVAGPSPFLEDLAGDHVALRVADLWQISSGLAVTSRGRVEWSRVDEGVLHAVPSVEARFNAGPGVVVRAEGGVVLGGRSAGDPVGRLEVSGRGGPVTVTAALDRDIGPALAEDRFAAPAPSRVVHEADSKVDRYIVDVTARLGGGLPSVRLTAERMDVEGNLATRLPHDLVFVPRGELAQSNVDRLLLEVGLARSGSTLLVEWEDLEQAAGPTLLPEGADGWERRSLGVRQRLLVRGGLTAYVMLGAEKTRLDNADPELSTEPLRAALLERRRYSGGMSLLF